MTVWPRIAYAFCGAGLLLGMSGCRGFGTPHGLPRVLVRDSLAAQQLNEQGLALAQEGRLEAAEENLRAALEADPYCGPAHCNLGVVLLQQGRFYDAGWELRHAGQLMPKAAAPRANLGLLYEQVGRYGPAEDELRRALAVAPDDIEIIGHLARVHIRQGKRTDETTVWLNAVVAEDDSATWRTWAGRQLASVRGENGQSGGEP